MNVTSHYPLLAVRPDAPWRSITDFVNEAKASPGKFRAAKAAIEDPAFVANMTSRGVDVDYRPGDKVRADLWREYRNHTELLKRIGMLKQIDVGDVT